MNFFQENPNKREERYIRALTIYELVHYGLQAVCLVDHKSGEADFHIQ